MFTLQNIKDAWDEALKGKVIKGAVGCSFDSYAFTSFKNALIKTVEKPFNEKDNRKEVPTSQSTDK